ncbi:hypothetical protein S83_005581 [Arachis hypogaea]
MRSLYHLCLDRFLKFYDSWRHKESANVHVSSTFDSFPNELRYLEWSGCPVKSLPPNFCAEKLVKLSLPDSQVSKLWDGVQLVELPDFTKASNLEEIELDYCESLCQLHPSILSIHKLKSLSVHGCKELKSLKGEIHLKFLKRTPSSLLKLEGIFIVTRGIKKFKFQRDSN